MENFKCTQPNVGQVLTITTKFQAIDRFSTVVKIMLLGFSTENNKRLNET